MRSIVKAAIISVVLLLVFGLGIFFIFRDGRKPQGGRGGGEPIAGGPELTGKEGEPELMPNFVPPPSIQATFTVRVIDEATRKLLPRSSILVQRITDGGPGEKVFESGRRPGGGSNGEFLVGLPPGMYHVRAQCPGYSSKNERVTAAKDRTQTVVLELGRGNSISGRVLTRDGRGIGGARVMAYPQIGNPSASMIERLIGIVNIQEDAQKPPGEAVSADDGSYQIDGLEKRYYVVKAVASKFTPGELGQILPTRDNVNFQLALGGEVPGLVFEAGSGAGIDGAKVMAYTHRDSADLFDIIETRSRPPFETVTTTSGGHFKLETLGVGTYNVVVTAPGYQEGRFLKIKVREGENPPQRFGLGRGLSISGVVLSSANEPVEGAKVRATRIGDTGRHEQMFIKFDDGSIYTDKDGKFLFDTLEAGKYTLLAWHHDHASEQRRDVDAGSADVTLTLPRGGAVAGRITEAGTGKPIPGARVTVSDMQDLKKEGLTDDNGVYFVGGLNDAGQGKRYLNIHADGYARLANVQVSVQDSKIDENQNFELERTALVTGRVVNKNGQGVGGARVMAKRKNANSPVPLTVGSGVTGDDGRYQIRDLEGGEETELSVISSEYLEGTSAPFAIQAGDTLELEDLVLELGGMVKGVVVGNGGQPVPGAQVSVRKEGETAPDISLSATSDNRGQFMLRGLSAGTIDLVAKSSHFLEEIVEGVKVKEGHVTQDVRIVLKQGSQVRGMVVDGDGRPVREAQVTARDISESGGLKELRTETEPDGQFTVENILSRDTIEITVEHADHGSWSSDQVRVGGDELKVVLPRLGGVRATVVDPQGNPLPSFTVQPQPRESGEAAKKRLSARTFQTGPANPDGSFEYTGIPPGVYDVYVRAPSYAAYTFPQVQVEGRMIDLGRAVLPEGGMVSGLVVDQAGRAVPGVTARVLGGLVKFNLAGAPRPTQDHSLTLTDGRGHFEFKNLKGGPVSIDFTAKGYVRKRLEDVDPNVADKARDLKVVLDQGAEIFGTVSDAQGNVKNGIQVYLMGTGDRQTESNQRTATNSEGFFQFLGLGAGTYRVTAQRVGESGTNAEVMVPLESGFRQEVQLVFE